MRHAPAPPQLVALDLSPERPVRTSCAPPWRPQPGSSGADMHYALEFGVMICGCMHRNHGAGWFRVGAGQAWATRSMEMHQWRVGRDMEYVVFQFLPSLLGRLPILEGFDITAPFRAPACLNVIGRRSAFRRRLAGLAAELLPKHQGDVPPGEVLWDMLRILRPVSAEVLRCAGPSTPHSRAPSAVAVAPAIDRLQQAAERIVSVDEAAQACHMARRTFCRSFRTTMGIGFAEFALRWRLVCAANALKSTDDRVKTIAHRFGFNGASHLHRAFRVRYGIGPARYRAASRLSIL